MRSAIARASTPTLTRSALYLADLQSFSAHVIRLAKAGVQPLLSGSMGEAHHLSHAERVTLIKTARQALDEAGFTSIPIIAGTGAGSTRETVELSAEAAAAGADYTIVICSGYFAGALAGNRKALKAFWTEVAEKSPIPVIIYNCECAMGSIQRCSADCDAQILVRPGASTSTLTLSLNSRLSRRTLPV